MKNKLLLTLLSFILTTGTSNSETVPNTNITTSGSILNITGAADSPTMPAGSSLGPTTGSQRSLICSNPSLNYTLSRIDVAPLATWTGVNIVNPGFINNGSYVYATGLPGVDIGPVIRGDRFNADLTGGVIGYYPVPAEQKTVWRGTIANASRQTDFPVFVMIYYYRGHARLENASLIPSMPMYKYLCYDNNNVLRETNTLVMGAQTVRINVTGCTPTSKTATVEMNGIPLSTMANAAEGTLIGTKNVRFGLTCDPNIVVNYSVVDLNDPTNLSTTSTLTSDSTAKGVGYAITRPSGLLAKFGPDGSAMGISNQEKYYAGEAGTANSGNPLSFQLGFSYVRNPAEEVKSGSAKSLIGITYSYQ